MSQAGTIRSPHRLTGSNFFKQRAIKVERGLRLCLNMGCMTERNSVTSIAEGARLPRLHEAAAWRPLGGTWRQLYGGFYESGVSIEWHDVKPAAAFDWSRTFHPQSLELCLNLEGEGSMQCGATTMKFKNLSAGFYVRGEEPIRARREAAQRHRFITVEVSAEYARRRLAGCDGALHAVVERFVLGRRDAGAPGGLGRVQRLTAEQEQLVTQMQSPSTPQAARPLWYEGKLLQLMAEFFFQRPGEDELFCDRQKRLARERVERVTAILRQNLCEPPSLEEIGRRAGCSPFHLSRTFSRETGLTIPQYVRKLRMERAAELLQSGKYNVTEAAVEVGYSSLSHFSQAFCQTMGCCPGLFPLKKASSA